MFGRGVHVTIVAIAGINSNEARAVYGEAMWRRMAAKGDGDTMFSTYSHRKLCGPSSVTGFNGVTERFDYDHVGRLAGTAVGGQRVNAYDYSVGGGVTGTYIKSRNFTRSAGEGGQSPKGGLPVAACALHRW